MLQTHAVPLAPRPSPVQKITITHPTREHRNKWVLLTLVIQVALQAPCGAAGATIIENLQAAQATEPRCMPLVRSDQKHV